MNKPYYKWLTHGWMPVVMLMLAGCASQLNEWHSREDLSKIYVFEVTEAPNLHLPDGHATTKLTLTQAVRQQLQDAGKLQTDAYVHSLTFYGAILSYQDGLIEVQGELYDDDRFLVYSRVKRRLVVGEDWGQGLNLIAAQLLDELMYKLNPTKSPTPPCVVNSIECAPPPEPCGFFGCEPWIDWGYWRNIEDDDHNRPRKKVEPHWLPGAIREHAPRGEILHQRRPHPVETLEYRSTSSTESGGSSSWFPSFSGSSSSSTSSTTTHEPSRTSTVTESAPATRPSTRDRSDSDSGARATPSRPAHTSDGEQSGRTRNIESAAPGRRR